MFCDFCDFSLNSQVSQKSLKSQTWHNTEMVENTSPREESRFLQKSRVLVGDLSSSLHHLRFLRFFAKIAIFAFACKPGHKWRECCMLATFTKHCCTRACALGPLVACQGPGVHKHQRVALKMLHFDWPALSTHVATSCINVARCCFEVLRAFGHALMEYCESCKEYNTASFSLKKCRSSPSKDGLC